MEFSLSDLLCHEDFFKKPELEEEDDDNPFITISESDDEYIQQLIEEETILNFNGSVLGKDGKSLHSDAWLKCARLGAIDWVLDTRATFGFQFRTAFLSLTYFDRFLSKRSLGNGLLWAIQLLSVACLSIAVKMEELRPPALSRYHVPRIEFASKESHKMELMVLATLEWKMGSTTPFAYLNYFTAKFCVEFKDSKPHELVSSATQLILAVPKVVNVMDFRPSVIAFAAILAASDDHQLTRNALEIKMSAIPSLGSLPKDDVHNCYNLMLEIKMEKSSTPESVVLSPNSNPIYDREIPLTSGVATKRRLTYNDCDDQNCRDLKRNRP